jgi:hypothetical protein
MKSLVLVARARGASTFAWLTLLALLLPRLAVWGADDRIVLALDRVPPNGLVLARVNLSAAAQWGNVSVVPHRLRAVVTSTGKPVPAQFVPDPGRLATGTLVLQCDPASPPASVWLDFSAPPATNPPPSATFRTRWFSVTHDPQHQGGLPTDMTFADGSPKFEGLRWNDRLYHRQTGQFWLRHDRQPKVEWLSHGPVCSVVRVTSRYCQPDGKRPASQPAAVYEWFYFHDQPLVHVRARVSQETPQTWHEGHFLELGFPTNGFSHWAGGEPSQEGIFRGNDQSRRFSQWGAVFQGRNGIGLFDAGPVLVYDGLGYGRYLHAHGDAAWQEWHTTQFERTAWLWIGAAERPTETLKELTIAAAKPLRVTVSTERLQARLASLQSQLTTAEEPARPEIAWRLAATRLLEKHGRLRDALELPAGQWPPDWTLIAAGDLRLILERSADGLAMLDLVDVTTGNSLLGTDRGRLFELTLRHAQNGEERRLSSVAGWVECSVQPGPEKNTFTLRWAKPHLAALGNLTVTARIRSDTAQHRLAWNLQAEGQAPPWSLWRVGFPQVTLAAASADSQLLLPQAAGVLKPVGRERLNRFHGQYPSGWMTMQVAALYDATAGTGLYFGLHDPLGATKDFTADHGDAPRSIRLVWDIPVPDMGQAGNRFTLSGEAVWQFLRGDWFDAALIYRDWARREAKWFPSLGAEGRADTPLWKRELSAWAMTGGGPKDCVPRVLEFARALGVPVGFHWYNWHQIPFDNDYPHYFPTREGFTEGVKALQAGGVHVMPYINGRLWDTRDQGTNDFEFTRLARPAATKRTDGEPYIETYGSKEAHGQDVRLAVMCPTTALWRERQHETVRRLFTECGVQGVYIDQVAAAKPELCFDASHGHPLGGGSWWNERGYWPLLDRIRADKPPDRMLTTECNAEPFLRWFDGYLTWHWQYDGQVPLFPAVYGGAVQMFGRAYRGGPTKDLALRMKAAQQLVWGEQPGWLDPSVVREPENFAFFRDVVQLRWKLRRYFHAGQMARPPKLTGAIPNVTADWQWSGVWPVTTPAAMVGAWLLPAEKRLVLLFANVSDEPITAPVEYDLRETGLTAGSLARRKWTPQGEAALESAVSVVLRETVTFPPRQVWAWEINAR